MDGPLSVVLKFSHGAQMLAAVGIGVGFGFALERGGFGRADNLAAIFYGRDFRVMRVMFTAIVTAMLGLYFLDLVGVVPLSSIGLLDTYLLPQLVGGLILGAGFIVGGYCPGTSLVAAASGKIDALLFIGGLLAGSLVFTLGYDSLASFQNSTAMGRVLLHEYLGVPSAVMVFAVVLFAVGAFFAVGKIEAAVRRSLKP
ncbi:MAG: YeeE/YedE family protein [Deltaproteobacteria bacterium]|nr:YeeE/YedE family protein [Deltaproteobacteria bacterium]